MSIVGKSHTLAFIVGRPFRSRHGFLRRRSDHTARERPDRCTPLFDGTATTILSQENVFAIAHVIISDLAIHRDRSLGDTRTWFSSG